MRDPGAPTEWGPLLAGGASNLIPLKRIKTPLEALKR